MFELYSTTSLIAMIEPLRVPGNFLLALFFPGMVTFDTAEVKLDRVFEDLRIAPFVSPFAPGKPDQDKGFQTETFVPAYVKPMNRVDPEKLTRRRPGEPIGGNLTPQQRRDLTMLDYVTGHKTKIDRRHEVMASSIVRSGSVVIVGEDYPSATVNFGRDAALTKALAGGARWGEAGVSPYDDVEAWADQVGETVGAAPNIVIFDKKAWDLFKVDPKVEKAIDREIGQTSALQLGFQPGVPGAPIFKGRIGELELYVYNDTYEDVDGVVKKLIPDYTVIIGATGAYDGAKTYGAILDPRAGYQATPWFPKNWIEENPAAEWVMTQSAPLLVPKRANASLCATVR